MRVMIKSVSYIETINPEGSCGTGYSVPNTFEFKFIEGDDMCSIRKTIDIWYAPKESIKKLFVEQMTGRGYFFWHRIVNLYDAFVMYLDEVEKYHLCPWTKDEILAAS